MERAAVTGDGTGQMAQPWMFMMMMTQWHMSYRFTVSRSCQQTFVYCCVYSEKIPDDVQRSCPKHVEFYSKNKFEKLLHLVGFIIRIYHDAGHLKVKNFIIWAPTPR